MTNIGTTPTMTPSQIKLLEKVTGFLYIARALDDTMLHAVNELATSKSDGTQEIVADIIYFLDYCACNPNPVKLYCTSDMFLHIHSDAAYLVARRARSQARGFFFLGNKDSKFFNTFFSTATTVMMNVLASAAESEVGACYLNARAVVPHQVPLIELGHKQPPTPI